MNMTALQYHQKPVDARWAIWENGMQGYDIEWPDIWKTNTKFDFPFRFFISRLNYLLSYLSRLLLKVVSNAPLFSSHLSVMKSLIQPMLSFQLEPIFAGPLTVNWWSYMAARPTKLSRNKDARSRSNDKNRRCTNEEVSANIDLHMSHQKFTNRTTRWNVVPNDSSIMIHGNGLMVFEKKLQTRSHGNDTHLRCTWENEKTDRSPLIGYLSPYVTGKVKETYSLFTWN